MDTDPRDQPSVDINEARRLFAMADSDDTFDSWLADRRKMAFYQTPRGGLLVRGFAERPWSKIFRIEGLAGTLVASYWDIDWPQDYSDPTTDGCDADIEDEPEWRPAEVEISGIEGTFDGEIGWAFDWRPHRGRYEAVRFTAEVADAIATAFASRSDDQLNDVDEEDVGSDVWDSDKYGSFLPRASFSPGEFHVVTGDGEWESINPDEDGMYRLEFDGFYWEEVKPLISGE
jgi:hypothetical protein